MKTTLIATFAIALMVFAFNTNPANANEECWKDWTSDECFSIAGNQIDKLKDPDETEVASWDDDEKADQYGDEWFKVDESGNIEVAYGCKMNSDGSVHCPGDAWNSKNDESKVAWDTEPDEGQYCWQTVGKNGPETKCVPAAWKERYDTEKQIASYWENCLRSGNCMMKEDLPEKTETASLSLPGMCWKDVCFNEEDASENVEVAWQPSIRTRPRGNNDSAQERTRVNQPFGNEESGESDIAYGATCTTDWSTGEQVCCTAYSGGGMFCYYPNAVENEGTQVACSGRDAVYGCSNEDESSDIGTQVAGFEYRPDYDDWFNEESSDTGTQVAGMTMDEKVQQDEDDWNAYILQQMFAGIADYCKKTGNCMMSEDGDSGTEFARPYPPPGSGYCDPYTVGTYCPSNNQDEGAEQREFARESSFGDRSQSASDGDNASLVGDSDKTIEAEDTENERVLESGDY